MTALEEIKKGATQEEIAAAWSAWQSRHGGKLGPGPAFVEAINSALAIRLPTLESLQRENDTLRRAQSYTYIGRDGKSVLARDLEDRAEAAEAEVKRLNAILEPFRAVSKDWVDENGWTDVACQKDRIVDWFGPSDFRALASTGGEHHAE